MGKKRRVHRKSRGVTISYVMEKAKLRVERLETNSTYVQIGGDTTTKLKIHF